MSTNFYDLKYDPFAVIEGSNVVQFWTHSLIMNMWQTAALVHANEHKDE